MASPRLVFAAARGSFDKLADEIKSPVARAATAAITEAGEIAKREGRASIAAGGFSRKWQNALRTRTYPSGQPSMNAAVFVYHKINYANVFEDGASISGKPLLWLPLPNVPVVRGGPLKASKFKSVVGEPLHTIKRPGKPPLLAARVRTTDKRAAKGLSLSLLRRGANLTVKNGKVIRGRGTLRSVPLYIGIPLVTISKRFDIAGAVAKAKAQLGALFLKHLKGE